MQGEPEDALDQVMNQSWQAVAQSIRQSGIQINNEIRRLKAEDRTESRAKATRYEAKRNTMAYWKRDNRRQLDDGFSRTLNATILNPNMIEHPERWDDTTLVKSWVVADQLGDGRYLVEKTRAKELVEQEYERRHPGQPIQQAAEGLMQPVTIRYTDHEDPGFLDTQAALGRAGTLIDLQPVDPKDADGFRREHNGESFSVQVGEETWNGMNRERLTQAVLTSETNDPVQRISFLKSNLSELTHADNTATGAEPEAPREHTQSDNVDAAPMEQPTDTEHPDDTPPQDPGTDPRPAEPVTVERADESVGVLPESEQAGKKNPDKHVKRPMEDDPIDGGRNMFGYYSVAEQVEMRLNRNEAQMNPTAPTIQVTTPEQSKGTRR
ncbi:MAG: hypothetical protein LKI88_03815 [Bifidobacterium sp.]|jgi:hypothetical protein|nr:hypothetical protein [Bifidobacterium sp.]MCI1865047.1 hypothetical protein [Bifidobacterium sp.]